MKTYQFTCPECKKHELGSVEQVILTYPITRIPSNGDLDYDTDNPTAGDGQVLAYQCMNCGYELKDEQGNTITDCTEVAKWVKKHCHFAGTGKKRK
jgi:rubredoxin